MVREKGKPRRMARFKARRKGLTFQAQLDKAAIH
jgi:hypothetical protein